MREVLAYLVDYQRKYFDWKLYLSIGLFLSASLFVNYLLDFEDTYIDRYHGQPVIWLWMFLFQLLPYLGVCWILMLFGKVDDWSRDSNFWIRVTLGFSILGFERAFYGTKYLDDYFSQETLYFIVKCLNSSSSILTVVVPLLLLYYLLEKKDDPKIWYGLSLKKFDLRPYILMLLLMSVVIGLGSFMPDIQKHYPRVLHVGMDSFLKETHWPRWLSASIYELCYGSNFISVELFFRGYLIFAFTRMLGPYVVLPMVASYCFLHYGKPVGEAISSIFGGYVLGIISLNSRNIWGGILIHLGVAWLMELFGWLQALR